MLDRHKIQIDDLFNKGIKYEEAGYFQNSVFSAQYHKAANNVVKIVHDNRRLKTEKNTGGRWHEAEIPNVISVVGRRGTGKTSMMRSFTEALSRYSAKKVFSGTTY